MRPSRMIRSAALLLVDHCPRDSTGQLALGALKAFMLLTDAPAASSTRCPPNLNSHNHNQHAGRPCFSLAFQIERSTPTLRYDISRLRNSASHVSAHAIHAHADCSSLHRSTMTEPSGSRCKTERSASDADDNRTALWVPFTARFADFGMSVSLPTFIQKNNGCRGTSHLREGNRRPYRQLGGGRQLLMLCCFEATVL
jgi:hypothetical protein